MTASLTASLTASSGLLIGAIADDLTGAVDLAVLGPQAWSWLERLCEALPELGIIELGESRPQELWHKAAALSGDVHWHLVGHLQRNKIERTAPLIHLLHSAERADARLLWSNNLFLFWASLVPARDDNSLGSQFVN